MFSSSHASFSLICVLLVILGSSSCIIDKSQWNPSSKAYSFSYLT